MIDKFALLCQAHGLPPPTPEWRFHPTRQWRFDYAFVPARIAVEVEGGVFTHGRHSRGAGMLRDMEKYNHAALAGWCVLRFTPDQIATGACLPLVHAALARLWVERGDGGFVTGMGENEGPRRHAARITRRERLA